MSQVQAITR